MKFMKRRGLRMFAVAAFLPAIATGALAQSGKITIPQHSAITMSAEETATVQQVTQLVRDFLAAVPKGEKQTFDNFFADDVIYTRSTGVTVTKADVIKNIGVRATNEPQATFEADDFTVHPYGGTAVVNFRLVMHNIVDGKQTTSYFRNTGTFLWRNHKWQVIAWQATKVPPAAEPK
jgi:ketosteroid isomerase-like protein